MLLGLFFPSSSSSSSFFFFFFFFFLTTRLFSSFVSFYTALLNLVASNIYCSGSDDFYALLDFASCWELLELYQ